jgi:hypothetical protein
MAKSMLVKSDELVTITIYYQVRANRFGIRQYKILEEEEFKKLAASGSVEADSLTTKWSVPTWHTNNYLVRSSTFYSPSDGASKIDWSKYQDNLFKTCLKEWDVEDDDGKTVPVTVETIGSLPSVIASALLDKYNGCLSLEEEDKKK